MSRARTISVAAATAALTALAALSALGVGAQAAKPTRCKQVGKVPAIKIRNIEAIIDDSGSMRQTDPNRLRVAGLELFVSDPNNATKTLGVVEFGSTANTVFRPRLVGPNGLFMVTRLRAQVKADNGGTTYDSGFIKGRQDNPGAQGRIFLTDGSDFAGFTNTHRGGPRTFVVGLGIGKPGPNNPTANQLQRIADETGGVYFPNVAAATLQPTFRAISLAINCLPRPRTFRSGLFTKRGQKSRRTPRIDTSATRLELVLNWAGPRNRFAFSRVEVLGKRNKVLASLSGRGKPKKLRTTKTRGRSFRSLSFKKPKGTRKLRFTVKAIKLARRERTITQLTEIGPD